MIRPLRDLILVKRYTRPATTEGGLVIPESWNTPGDGDLWEVLDGWLLSDTGNPYEFAQGKDVQRELGYTLQCDDILITNPARGTHHQTLTRLLGFDVFFLRATEVRSVLRYNLEDKQTGGMLKLPLDGWEQSE